MPEVSVIVPIYNTSSFLEECLESVVAQTFQDFEAILVDDGSTDSSARIAEGFAKKDSRFRLVRQCNMGLSEARNTGLRNAQGNWIAFVDSDDVLSPDFLKTLWQAAIEMDVPVVASGIIAFSRQTPRQGFSRKTSQRISSDEALVRAFYQNAVPDFSACNKLYRKSLWETRKFPPGIYFEDMATIPRSSLRSIPCRRLQGATLFLPKTPHKHSRLALHHQESGTSRHRRKEPRNLRSRFAARPQGGRKSSSARASAS